MKYRISRRDLMQLSMAGVLGGSMSGWLPALAADKTAVAKRKRSCILLWMNGGPSTIDMFDLKVGHDNGGPFKEIAAGKNGLKISEHLPNLAKHGDRLAVVRSMSTKEGDHSRATYFMRTGNLPQGAIQFPTIGSLISKELGDAKAELPNFVSFAAQRFVSQGAFGPGFLGPNYAPLMVGENQGFARGPQANIDEMLKVQDLALPKDISQGQASERYDMLRDLETQFMEHRPNEVAQSHATAYDRAVRLMQSVGSKAFDLTEEKAATRDAYGRTVFGQGCLLARRLIEKNVPFVEVNLGGWDTHGNNFPEVKRLSEEVDKGWAALMADLQERGLLDTTTIIWMGEFGRTPKINNGKGRDHYPNAYSAVVAGGGIKGGQAYGKTTDDGTKVDGEATSVADLLATLCAALGIDGSNTNNSNVGRPIRVVDKAGKPIKSILA